jgi:pathogenesis-related protein 1
MKVNGKLLTYFFGIILAFATQVYAIEIDTAAFVDAHNEWRAGVGVGEKLHYSVVLARSAQAWVDHLKQVSHCRMRHSVSSGRYGENLYWASALQYSDGRYELQNVSVEKIVDSWGSEKADYDYMHNQCAQGKMCGHYTQMVWRTTTAIGCAMTVCEDTLQQIWVCQYQPGGNLGGQKPY